MYRILTFLFSIIGMLTVVQAQTVYVLPLDDEVDQQMWLHTKRACDEARREGADLFVVHVNTYGGAVDAADSIRTALLRLNIPTVAFVDHNAASAGALITLACDSVFMAPGSSMGASTVVGQDGQPMPDKYQSYMKAIMRSTAQSHGKYFSAEDSIWVWRRDPAVAEAMVTPDKVTSFTAEEAVAAGFAEGVSPSLDNMIRDNFYPEYRQVRFESNLSEGILGFLANPFVRAFLIMLIIGGIYLEMHTPGLGVPSAVALVAAVLYFLPMFLTGTMAGWVIVMFIIGLVLLALEIFVIPGFGIAGICGIAAILASIVGAMLYTDGISGAYASDLVSAITVTISGVLGSIVLIWYLTSKYGPKWFRRVSELQATQQVADGYIGVDTSIAKYLGREAETVTDMRPSGKIRIDDQDIDAVSLTGFIDAGRKVRITKFENAQLYVVYDKELNQSILHQ